MKKTGQELKEAAEQAWRKGFTPQEIKAFLQIPRTDNQLRNWLAEFKQSEFQPEQTIFAADNRLRQLFLKPDKNYLELREMQILSNAVVAFDTNAKNLEIARLKKIKLDGEPRKNYTARERDAEGQVIKRTREKPPKNDISHITPEMFAAFEEKHLYWHQKICVKAAFNPELNMIRMILKPRQHGQTFTEAYIAFKRAVLSGENHVFLSMTVALALMFKGYINKIACTYFDCQPFVGGSGDTPMALSNGAELFFLSPNSAGAQGKAGHLVFDECAWTKNFKQINDLATAITTQNYTLTYITTPSSIGHDFYEYWTGEWANKYRTKGEKFFIENKHKAFQQAGDFIKCGDGASRFMYDVHDAINHGFDRVTLASLRIKTPNPVVFKNIYELQFIDDSSSVFKISDILNCIVEDKDFKDYSDSKPVACTYDPSGSSVNADQAGLGFVEIPQKEKDVFRLLDYQKFRGDNSDIHINSIKTGFNVFNIERVIIDTTMGGVYVYPHVEQFFPAAEPIVFNLQNKVAMVHKMMSLVHQKRFVFKKSMQDEVINSFLSVKKGLTDKSSQGTYYWTRDAQGNHGELFVVCGMATLAEGMVPDYETEKIIMGVH